MALLTHRLDLFFVDAYCFIFWDLPRDVLVAPESALCGWIGVLLSLSLSLRPAPVSPAPSQPLTPPRSVPSGRTDPFNQSDVAASDIHVGLLLLRGTAGHLVAE